jgi:hypothetical protein
VGSVGALARARLAVPRTRVPRSSAACTPTARVSSGRPQGFEPDPASRAAAAVAAGTPPDVFFEVLLLPDEEVTPDAGRARGAFPAKVVRQLRAENGDRRTAARAPEERATALSERLLAAEVTGGHGWRARRPRGLHLACARRPRQRLRLPGRRADQGRGRGAGQAQAHLAVVDAPARHGSLTPQTVGERPIAWARVESLSVHSSSQRRRDAPDDRAWEPDGVAPCRCRAADLAAAERRSAVASFGPGCEGGGVTKQRIFFKRVLVVVLVVYAFLSVACDDNEEDDETAPTIGTTTTTLFGSAVQEWLNSTPDAISRDINTWGLVRTSRQEVLDLSDTLCVQDFDPQVVIDFLQARRTIPSSLLVRPLNRLALMASNRCSLPVTDAELARYGSDIFAYASLSSSMTGMTFPTVPNTLQSVVCGILGTHIGGDIVEAAAQELLSVATRERIQGGVFLGIAAEVAASSCNQWYPLAQDVLAHVANR